MRRLLPMLACLLLALPVRAEGGPRVTLLATLLAPDPRCEAPALPAAAELRAVRAAEEAPPPFRHAMLACAPDAAGPAKRPLRRT